MEVVDNAAVSTAGWWMGVVDNGAVSTAGG